MCVGLFDVIQFVVYFFFIDVQCWCEMYYVGVGDQNYYFFFCCQVIEGFCFFGSGVVQYVVEQQFQVVDFFEQVIVGVNCLQVFIKLLMVLFDVGEYFWGVDD